MLDALARHAQAIRDIPLVTGAPGELREYCTANGWCEREPGAGHFVVEAPIELRTATADDEEACPARVVLHQWEDWCVEDHPNKAEYAKALRAFDDLYQRADTLLSARWGTAMTRGRYRMEHQRMRWAMWPGVGGLRILAQDEPDIQLGMELDIWLVPWREGEDLPEMPLF